MNDLPDNFKDFPQSITEIKSDKTRRGSDWTPRDTLIDMLRDIDSGEVKPVAVVVAYYETQDDDPAITKGGWRASSKNIIETVGLLETTKIKIWESS